MNITEFFIRRPVSAIVLSLILIIIGIMGLNYLDTRFLPKFESNHLKIETNYPGASAKLIETSITSPVEESISGIEGVDTISSTSYQGYSKVVITLKDNVDISDIENKVRDRVDNIRDKLPSGVNSPQIRAGGENSGELLDIGVTNKNMSLETIRDYLQRYIINDISQIKGVAKVNAIGANTYIMQIHLDINKMTARKITINDVKQAIQYSNLELPAGNIKGLNFNYPVNTATKLHTAKEFNNIVVKQTADNAIKIMDIGIAEIAPSTITDSFVRVNDQPAILLSIDTTDEANPIDTSNRIIKYLNSISDQMPSGMKLNVVYDQSTFMKSSIHEVYTSIFFAILCVLFVIYLFLGQLRSVSIPIVTIPICIFATFGVMYILDFTINIITLLALVLSIGLVVDDAIVMLENIHRHLEMGESPMNAAINGSKEIVFAIIAMTLTLVAVYAPVGLVHGKISAIFKPFALTLAGAVIISGFVALTLSPMMCSKILKSHSRKTTFISFIDKVFNNASIYYQAILSRILNKKHLVLVTVLFIVITGGFVLRSTPFTFMPQEDIGLIIGNVQTPTGANINYISKQSQSVAKILGQQPGVESILSIADTDQQGFNMGLATLKSFEKRNKSAQQLSDSANKQIALIPGLNASTFPPSFGGSMKHQLEFSILGNKNYKQLYKLSQSLIEKLNQYPGLKNITSSLTYDSKEYDIHINRDLAAKLHVSVEDIDNVFAAMLGGIRVSSIDINGQSYDVYISSLDKYQHSLDSFNDLFVSDNSGKLIPISNFVTVNNYLSQKSLTHDDRQKSALIQAQLASGYSLGMVVKYLNDQLPKLLPADIHYTFQGTAKDSADSKSSMLLLFILAFVFIYLVLSAQFESFLDPFIILFAVPFSVVGALFALKIINGSINIYTIVGLVTLIGLIAKHGILITQFANELKITGLSAKDAILKAASIRLRPILMTTAAMIFGVIPLLFSTGASAISREQIGIVIASGLFFGTFFSLILIPVIYSYMDQFKQFLTRCL